MSVDDLWTKRVNGKKVPSARHGRGRRYRVRYKDATGKDRERLFELKRDADAWDAKARVGLAEETKLDQGERHQAFKVYAERWRLSREVGLAIETRRRVEANLRLHLYPAFPQPSMRAITVTSVMEWLTTMLEKGTPKTSIRLYFDLLKTILNAAVADKAIPDNPANAVKITQVLRGLSRVPKWVPTAEQVVALLDVVPPRYLAALWLGAGQALRVSEALGMENGTRCTDFLRRELHVVQQLRHSSDHGGFYLSPPKSGSSGTLDLDPDVAAVLAEHIRQFPPVEIEVVDTTSGDPVKRTVALLFTNDRGGAITDKRWAEMWSKWRTAAGWPDEGFHALRHFCATTLITHGVEPQAVQKALRHASLRITLETYVGYWPKSDRPRGVVGGALRAANRSHGNDAMASEIH